jgi:DNA-binding NarL/FixJ family response regulator
MTAWIVLAALVTALALCALLVSLYALYRANLLSHSAAETVTAARKECSDALESMRAKFESMANQVHDSPRPAAFEPLPGTPKACMNLTRRSQALRLRRQGDSPERIAESLEIPRQEVDLLFKVHEIVLNNL